MTNNAVLFLVFNRVDTTERVFAAIREARPPRLYIAADGPRKDVPGDKELCHQVRQLINVDWDCQVEYRLREKNMGGNLAIVDALDWFFDQEEMGIILEDDCLPSQEFFSFVDEMLTRFRFDQRIMHICGSNLQFGNKRGSASYYFSRISSVWGWASWRRTWKLNDPQMTNFPVAKKHTLLINAFPDRNISNFITKALSEVYEKKIETWDFPYGLSIMLQNGLSVVPNKNLISNLGFGSSATRTTNTDSIHAEIPLEPLGAIKHAEVSLPDSNADLFQLSLSMYNVSKSQLKKR